MHYEIWDPSAKFKNGDTVRVMGTGFRGRHEYRKNLKPCVFNARYAGGKLFPQSSSAPPSFIGACFDAKSGVRDKYKPGDYLHVYIYPVTDEQVALLDYVLSLNSEKALECWHSGLRTIEEYKAHVGRELVDLSHRVNKHHAAMHEAERLVEREREKADALLAEIAHLRELVGIEPNDPF